MLCMLLYLYGEWKLSGTSDAEDEQVSISLATLSAARLLLYSYVQRNMYKIIQRNIWKECGEKYLHNNAILRMRYY
ncbi:hypothetical protein T07_7392 [Trichinella nelsoni]|uniref:Uncharacterized protein n=1 Tax=Trichinella nelsoni TaxID=6336 RepID=A0A0V0S582_9BILA|nr:hypothetical protein T07_7392 [Trichinella nelsoni]